MFSTCGLSLLRITLNMRVYKNAISNRYTALHDSQGNANCIRCVKKTIENDIMTWLIPSAPLCGATVTTVMVVTVAPQSGRVEYGNWTRTSPTLARLRELAEKRFWPRRRGLIATYCHHSIFRRSIEMPVQGRAGSQSASLLRFYTKYCFA